MSRVRDRTTVSRVVHTYRCRRCFGCSLLLRLFLLVWRRKGWDKELLRGPAKTTTKTTTAASPVAAAPATTTTTTTLFRPGADCSSSPPLLKVLNFFYNFFLIFFLNYKNQLSTLKKILQAQRRACARSV